MSGEFASDPAPGDRNAIDGSVGLRGFRFSIVAVVFCISGVSALIYQVAWQRILAFHSGTGVYSVAMIVAAFMAGLGLGNYLGGRLCSRFTPSSALRVFALLELGIGLFALLSCDLYYDFLYIRWSGFYQSAWTAGILHFVALLLPTTIMGMSLPVLVHAAVCEPTTASRTIGTLYGINVIGAGIGALVTPWVLIHRYGIEGAVQFGAAGNLIAGLSVIALGLSASRSASLAPRYQPPARSVASPEPAGQRPFALWMALYGLSGFCALALEILWFRVVDVAVKSTAFTFGTVLSLYLFGLAAGSLVGGRLTVALERPLRAFLICQCAILAYAGASLLALVNLPADWPILDELGAYWIRYNEFPLGEPGNWEMVFLLYVVVPVFLYGPPTFLMGLSFAVLQRAVHDDRGTSGRKVGFLQASNIAGNVVGSLAVGLLLLNVFGTAGSLRFLLGLGVVFAWIGTAFYGARSRFGVAGALLLLLVFAFPSGDALWLRLHGLTIEPVIFEEDATAVTAAVSNLDGRRIFVNGKGHGLVPYGNANSVHASLGAIPAAIHHSPVDVAIIGLGSGETAWAAGFREETQRLTVFEIARPERRLLQRLAETMPIAELRRLVSDPRLRIVDADGRNALLHSDARYDIIEADALRPHSAYAGNIYSVEFFRLAADRLKRNGLMCTWSPTARVRRSFLAAFPHVVEFDGEVLVGSNEPIAIDPDLWMGRLADSRVLHSFGKALVTRVMIALRSGRPADPDRFPAARVNRDLFPRDEFRAPSDL
jgi:spermidine synthase